MPKKFATENTKAVAARARKAATKADADEKRKQAEEDEKWRDDDKNVARKQQRKEEQERKRLEALERKQTLKAAHDDELDTLAAGSGVSGVSGASTKVTRAQLDAHRERLNVDKQKQIESKHLETKKIVVVDENNVEENINRMVLEGGTARTVDQAISVLSDKTVEIDRHPEKRMKAAYTAFEEMNMPRLKQEHPTFRLSQLKQLLKKEWQKSSENPLNQRLMHMNQPTTHDSSDSD